MMKPVRKMHGCYIPIQVMQAITVCRCNQATSKIFQTYLALYTPVRIVYYIDYSIAEK